MAKIIKYIVLLAYVCITLPLLVIFIESSNLRVEAYQRVVMRKGDVEIVFLGDSITKEAGIWGIRLGRWGFDTLNLGRSTYTSKKILGMVDRVVAVKPKYCFVMMGVNDMYINERSGNIDFSVNYYKRVLSKLSRNGITPIIQLTLHMRDRKYGAYIDRLNDELRFIAQENNWPIIDLNPILCDEDGLKAEYARDSVHLNEDAYEIWESEIDSFLESKAI